MPVFCWSAFWSEYLVIHGPGSDQARFLKQFGEDVLALPRKRATS